MTRLVRVRDPTTRHQFTTTRELAEARGWQIINRPATDRDGYPLPPTPFKPLGTKHTR